MFDKRYHWLIRQVRLNKFTLGAEIGCMEGKTTLMLLGHCPELRLICVDLWSGECMISDYAKRKYAGTDFKKARRTFNREVGRPYKNRITELRGISWEMAGRVSDKTLDFVFIDADHDYESVKKDILAWRPKVREGGLLSGHDINISGVRKAVSELVDNYQITINQVWYKKL